MSLFFFLFFSETFFLFFPFPFFSLARSSASSPDGEDDTVYRQSWRVQPSEGAGAAVFRTF